MRRYQFLAKSFVYNALNKLRAAFLAAKDGEEVEQLMKAILTNDERIKIGRRIEVAQLLQAGLTYHEITAELKVGIPTVVAIAKKFEQYPHAFRLINKRENQVEKTYQQIRFPLPDVANIFNIEVSSRPKFGLAFWKYRCRYCILRNKHP